MPRAAASLCNFRAMIDRLGRPTMRTDNRIVGHADERRLNFFGGPFDDSGLYFHGAHLYFTSLLNPIIFQRKIARYSREEAADLNFGECLAYALARFSGQKLLPKARGFSVHRRGTNFLNARFDRPLLEEREK